MTTLATPTSKLETEKISIDINGNNVASRTYVVTETTGSPLRRSGNALFAQGIPEIGDAFESEQFTAICTKKSVENTNDARTFLVTVEYTQGGGGTPITPEPNEEPEITIESNLSTAETNLDVDGKYLEVVWQQPQGENDEKPPDPIPKMYMATIQRPQPVVRFRKKTNSLPTYSTVGKLNSATFLGEPPKKWLHVGLNAITRDRGASYEVEYAFQYDVNDWKVRVAFFKDDGSIPTKDEGYKEDQTVRDFDVYPLANFGILGI